MFNRQPVTGAGSARRHADGTVSVTAHRWQMTAPGEPLVKTGFAPVPGDGEVLVEVAGCGVCHTDLGYYYDGVRTNHALPLALGHEVSGRVIDAGAGAEGWCDRAVIVPAVIPCGECELCQRGKGTICRRQRMPGNDIQGGFATHVVVPATGLCAVDEQRLADAGLALADVSVLADAVTTPYQAVVQAGVESGDLAIVVGTGGVGGYAVQVAAAVGATVVAIDVDAAKLAQIGDYGAALTLDASALEPREIKKTIAAFASDRGLAPTEWFIFECSGTAAGQRSAYSLLVHGATLSVVGFTMDKVELRLSNLMAYHARALGNWGCSPDLYPAALELVLSGKVQLAPFVRQYPLEEINTTFEAAHAGQLSQRAVMVP